MFFGRKLLCLPYAVLSLTSVLLAPCPATCRCLWSHSGFVLRLPTSLRGAGKSKSAGSQSADDNTHILAAPYYTVKGGFKATLMISNQGPNELPVQIRLFNRNRAQFDLPALALSAHEVRSLDLGQSAPQGAEFEDGNVAVEFQGKRLELGGVVTLVNAAQSVIFDEELTEPARDFASNRLEGVWWKPAGTAETLLALSNTGSSPTLSHRAGKRAGKRSFRFDFRESFSRGS